MNKTQRKSQPCLRCYAIFGTSNVILGGGGGGGMLFVNGKFMD